MANKKKEKVIETDFEITSDNIFADIGVDKPEEELTKAELVWEIEQIMKKKKLSQKDAAKIMGINQPKVSALLRRRLAGFSVERLIHFLNALGQDVDIIVRPKPRGRKKGRISVYSGGDCHMHTLPMAAKSR